MIGRSPPSSSSSATANHHLHHIFFHLNKINLLKKKTTCDYGFAKKKEPTMQFQKIDPKKRKVQTKPDMPKIAYPKNNVRG